MGFTVSQTGFDHLSSTRQLNGLNLWMDQVNSAGGIQLSDGTVIKFDSVFYDDESATERVDVTHLKPYELAHLGLARTHQIVKPLNELTVKENVVVGACFGREDHHLGKARRIADEVNEFVCLANWSDQLAGHLNVAQKKRLELARALAARPYLLLLDEVLAGLNPSEIAEMVETIRNIREQGITIIMIEHVMHAVMNVSERIIVLDYGQQIAEGTPEEIANNEKVIEAYLGDPKLAERLMEMNNGDS